VLVSTAVRFIIEEYHPRGVITGLVPVIHVFLR
jgi:hypothetical protein